MMMMKRCLGVSVSLSFKFLRVVLIDHMMLMVVGQLSYECASCVVDRQAMLRLLQGCNGGLQSEHERQRHAERGEERP